MKKLLIAFAALTVAYSSASYAAPGEGKDPSKKSEANKTDAERAADKLKAGQAGTAAHSRAVSDAKDKVAELVTLGEIPAGKKAEQSVAVIQKALDSGDFTVADFDIVMKRARAGVEDGKYAASILAQLGVIGDVSGYAKFLNKVYSPMSEGKDTWKKDAHDLLVKSMGITNAKLKEGSVRTGEEALRAGLEGVGFKADRIKEILCTCYNICG